MHFSLDNFGVEVSVFALCLLSMFPSIRGIPFMTAQSVVLILCVMHSHSDGWVGRLTFLSFANVFLFLLHVSVCS